MRLLSGCYSDQQHSYNTVTTQFNTKTVFWAVGVVFCLCCKLKQNPCGWRARMGKMEKIG